MSVQSFVISMRHALNCIEAKTERYSLQCIKCKLIKNCYRLKYNISSYILKCMNISLYIFGNSD